MNEDIGRRSGTPCTQNTPSFPLEKPGRRGIPRLPPLRDPAPSAIALRESTGGSISG